MGPFGAPGQETGDPRDRAPAEGDSPARRGAGPAAPGISVPPHDPSARGLAHRRRSFPPRRRAETMSAETASGPTEDQVEILEYNFNKVNKHPDPTTLCLIAAEAGLSEEETQVSPARAPTPCPPRPSRECGVPLALDSHLAALPLSSVASAGTPGVQTPLRSTAASQLPGSEGAPSAPQSQLPQEPFRNLTITLPSPCVSTLPTAREKRAVLSPG